MQAAAQLALAASRVAAVARVHQHLYVGDGNGMTDCGAYLRRLCDDLSSTLRPGQGAISIEIIDVALPTTKIVHLGLIVAELVTMRPSKGRAGSGSRSTTPPRGNACCRSRTRAQDCPQDMIRP
jgi:hypothetical protein